MSTHNASAADRDADSGACHEQTAATSEKQATLSYAAVTYSDSLVPSVENRTHSAYT
jgi:hypothetical protein